jgi:hypothetical protein
MLDVAAKRTPNLGRDSGSVGARRGKSVVVERFAGIPYAL